MNKKQKKMLIRIIIAAVLIVVFSLLPAEGYLRFVLFMIPYLVIGYDILKKAFKGILNKQAFDENFLMAVATVGAILLGDYSEGVAVMLFYQIGELFQSYAVGKSRRNISELMDIRPDYANIEKDGTLEQVDPDEVEIGTIIVVQPGEKVGAVLVIAFFYTSDISLLSIGVGVAFLMVMYVANRLGVKNVIFYGVVGICGVWTAFLMSGIHATIAAVLAAFMIPADARISEPAYMARAEKLIKRFRNAEPNSVSTLEPEQVEIIGRMIGDSRDAIPPLQRLEHSLHPLVSFIIMPVFALANAGISFEGINPADVFSDNVAVGVMLGLLIGKPLGISASVLLLTRLGIARMPSSVTVRRLFGVGFLASIGFTMSMFISTLAFVDEAYLIDAKLGIFAASIVGGVVGYVLLKK